jgi:hypothetical protein
LLEDYIQKEKNEKISIEDIKKIKEGEKLKNKTLNYNEMVF